MFNNLSTTTKVLLGATAVGVILSAVSAIKDSRECCTCEECCEEIAELLDPTVEQ